MPVEIKELVIRAVAAADAQDSEGSPQSRLSPEEREAIVEECVRQVLRILKKKAER
jgi:hypothetical protein